MLTGKHIVITGASRGIGRAIALKAAEKGARVGINYHKSPQEAMTLADEIQAGKLPEPMLLPFDATSSHEIQKGVDLFMRKFDRIDGWVNNAAINNPGLLPVTPEEQIREQIDSALVGPILCSRLVLPQMLPNKAGSIVNSGSIVTEKVSRGQSVYAAAKGGIVTFTRALACEYARKGIRANCILPGCIETEMFETTKQLAGKELLKAIPMGRFGKPEDTADLVIFLLSDSSQYITGTAIPVDGGYGIG